MKENLMTILFEEEGDVHLIIKCEEIAARVMEEVLDYVDCPFEIEVNLLLTMNNEIQEMNNNFRDINKPTDVLSFPMVEFEEPGSFEFLEESLEYFNLETGELLLGDIVISKEKVIEQALEYGHSVEREFAFLIAHSMLHLFGYDHISDEDRKIMESKQSEILDRLQILR